MAKRRQTTGLPKSPQQKSDEISVEREASSTKSGVRRRYRSRAEREATLQRRLVLGTLITAAVLVVILVVAISFEQFIRPNQVVATVRNTEILVEDYEARIQMERAAINFQITGIYLTALSNGASNEQLNAIFEQEPYSTWVREVNVKEQLGSRVINEMVNDILIVEELDARDISVGNEEIQEQINDFFNFDPAILEANDEEAAVDPTPTPFVSPTPSPEPTAIPEAEVTDGPTPFPTSAIPTLVPEPTRTSEEIVDSFNQAVNNFYDDVIDQTDLTRPEVDAYFATLARRSALREMVTEEVSNLELYTNARHILVENEGEAQDVITALSGGESFAALARAISTDTGSGAQGGELGWTPVRGFVEPFADAVAEAEVGAIIGPIQTQFGYHIIQVTAREDREMSEPSFEAEKEEAFEDWLQELRTENQEQIEITNRWLSNIPVRPQLVLPG